jgi:3-oxochol-4-en-24-oyl-CoA dehydrogenase
VVTSTDLRSELAASAAAFVRDHAGPGGLRERGEGVLDRGSWSHAAALGFFDLLVPEEAGGLGLGTVELGAVAEAAGRGLLVGPLVATAVAGALVRGAGVVLEGVTALADAVDGRLEAGPDGPMLHGRARHVDQALVADQLVVRVGAGSRPAVVVVSGDAPGLTVRPVPSADPTTSLAEVVFDAVPVVATVATGPDAVGLLARLDELGPLVTASRTVGVLDALLAVAVEHARTREQFGRAIGSFQALAHLLADLATTVEITRSAVRAAELSVDGALPEASRRVRVAAATASRAARSVAEGALQTLGGIGFTLEHDLHLYYRHALALQAAWGDEIEHERALADGLLDEVADGS